MAPSPTGFFHIGNAKTALYNWLLARKQGGTFILRLEDTDVERSKEEYADILGEAMTWLGIGWDDGTEPWDLLSAAYRDAHRLVVPFRDFDGIPRGFQARAIGESRTRWAGPLNPDGASWSR